MSNGYVDKVSAVGTVYDIHVPNGTIDRAMLDTDLQEKTDAVNDLKSAIDEIYTGFVFNPDDFEKGGITGANANDSYRNACRCRLAAMHMYPFDIEIKTTASNTAFNVYILNTNGAYVSDTGWKTTYTIPRNTNFRIMIDGLYHASSATLTVPDILAKISTSNINMYGLQAQINNIVESAIYVNVKDYGATGDGTTDDTQAIQDAFNTVKTTGGTVYIPAGTYLVNTILFDSENNNGQPACLHIYSNTTLLMDKNAVLKKGHDVSRILMTHNESSATGYDGCENIVIDGGVFDGDNTLATPDVGMGLLYFSHGKFLTLRNARFINSAGSWHALECNSSRDVLIDNCEFNITASNGAIDIDAAHNSGNLGQNDDTVCYNIEIRSCWFNTKWRPGVQNHTQFNHHNIRVHDNVFYMQGSDSTRGAISFHTGTTKVDVYNNTFYNNAYNADAKAFEMISDDQTSLFHDNRVEDMGTPYVNCKAYNNMLNGVFTA